MSVAIRNANDGSSLAQTADSALGEISNLVQRLRELAVPSANGTVSDADRESIQSEATQIISQIDDIATNTSFNGVKLTDGSQTTVTLKSGASAGTQISLSMTYAKAATMHLTADSPASPTPCPVHTAG